MEYFWEAIKGLGAVVGLVTGIFVVWDRFWKMTPTAVVVMRPVSEHSSALTPKLSIRNPADRPMIFRWKNRSEKGRFGLSQDILPLTLIKQLKKDESEVVIDAGQTMELDLHKPDNIDSLEPDSLIKIDDMHWRFAQPKIWKWDRPVRVKLTKRSMMTLDPDGYRL